MSLVLQSLKKSYENHLILDIPEFVFEPHSYWIQGMNGSGKTTLLKTIAGMLPYEGEIQYEQISLRKERMKYLQRVSYAAAEPLYPAFLTGKELIEFYTACRSATKRQVSQLLSVTGVKSFAEYKIGSYSSGMVKKLSLMLAFIGKPQLLLLDEPLITIDQASLHFIYEELQVFLGNGGTLLFTSHQQPDEKEIPDLTRLRIEDSQLIAL